MDTYPDILRRLDFRTSSPMSMILRPIVFMINGLIVSTAVAGPETANINFPAAATALAPKTGAAIKVAPYSLRCDLAHSDVSGWIVEVSTKILPFNASPATKALFNRSIRTSSVDI